MKAVLSILHITDLHISDSLPPNYELKIRHAVDAAITKIDGTRLFVVISGDIANTGDAKEYDRAEKVLSYLLRTIEERHGGSTELIMVPGNHDVCRPPKYIPEERGDKGRKEQLAKMEDFFCFSICRGVEWGDRDVLVDEFPLPTNTGFSGIRFCCLNTAPFSTLTFDKGVHILSDDAFSALRNNSPSDLSVVVAHHGPDWLDDVPRLEFEAEASNSVDLLLVGHEHRGGTVVKSRPGGTGLPILRGGMFSFDDEKECNFSVLNVAPLRMGLSWVDETRFEWDSSSRIFTSRLSQSFPLKIKGAGPKPNEKFFEELSDEIGRGKDFFAKSFSFPRLRSYASLLPEDDGFVSSQPVDIESAGDFFSYLEKWDCVEIAGSGGSGKSCLARDIYIECAHRGYIPILIHPNNSTRSFEKTLDTLISEQYGGSRADIDVFRQAPREKKIIIADDFDRIKRKKRNEPEWLVKQMLESFGKVILTVPDGNNAISRALIEGDVREFATFGRLELCPCTKQVRDPLVTRLCQAASLEAGDIGRMIRAVDRAVSNHAGLFELTPAFVTQYVDYFLANRTEMLSQDELPFKHIFDSNIRGDMLEAAESRNKECWDPQLVGVAISALQDVALQMHIQRKSVMDVHDASTVITTYAEEHDIKLNPLDVLDVADKAHILIRLKDGYSYMFSSLYVHAYFVARRIDAALDLGEEGVGGQIDRLLNEICFPVNEEVVVFLTQMRLSAEFPKGLVSRARRLVGNTASAQLFDPQVHPSLHPLLDANISAIDEKKAGGLTLIEDRIEADSRERFDKIEYSDYYDCDTGLLEKPVVRAFMAVRYIELAAGYLVRHYAEMPRETKREIREAIFQIPLSAADVVMSDIDNRLDELVSSFESSIVDGLQDARKCELFARRFIAAVSLGLCNVFLCTVMAHASEGRVTVDYLLDVEGDCFGYGLGRLLARHYIGDSAAFVNSAVDMAEQARKNGHQIELILIKIFANQHLRESGRIKLGDKHRLVSGVFGLPGDSSSVPLGLRGQ